MNPPRAARATPRVHVLSLVILARTRVECSRFRALAAGILVGSRQRAIAKGFGVGTTQAEIEALQNQVLAQLIDSGQIRRIR